MTGADPDRGYRREEAYGRYGLHAFRTYNDHLRFRAEAGGYVSDRGDENHRDLIGFYRWSDTLGFYMPAAVPDTVAQRYDNGQAVQVSLTASTASDDSGFDDSARARTESAINAIGDAFDGFMDPPRRHARWSPDSIRAPGYGS